MNTKRQTIWLISMLSIMVVLSAYYLFTDNTEELRVASEDMATNEDWDSFETVLEEADESTAAGTEALPEENAAQETQTEEAELTDEEILDEVENQTDDITAMQLERQEEWAKETERLLSEMTEAESMEATAQAYDELLQMEEKEEKVSNIEAQLMQEFENVIVTEEENQWKVIVQTDNMEKSQAVSIVDLVMKELNVGPERVVVQLKR